VPIYLEPERVRFFTEPLPTVAVAASSAELPLPPLERNDEGGVGDLEGWGVLPRLTLVAVNGPAGAGFVTPRAEIGMAIDWIEAVTTEEGALILQVPTVQELGDGGVDDLVLVPGVRGGFVEIIK
jgi:hypothetical protein